MKALCLIGHTIPLGPGRFDAYEQWRIYDVENPEGAYWEIIPEAAAGGDPVPALEKKKSGKSRIKADPAEGGGKPLIHLETRGHGPEAQRDRSVSPETKNEGGNEL